MRCSIPRAAWCSARPTTVCRCRWPCSIGCSSPEVSEKSLMIMHRSDQALAIRALRSAAPYIRMYQGRAFGVGGGVVNDLVKPRLLGLGGDLSIEGVGISGLDAGLERARKRAPVRLGAAGELIDFVCVGDNDAVDTTVLRKLVDNGLVPV